MIIFENPPRESWDSLVRRRACDSTSVSAATTAILRAVKARGDKALLEYTARFDGVELADLRCTPAVIEAAQQSVPRSLARAIDQATQNIEAFHRSQIGKEDIVESTLGVRCFRESRPLERVGIYVPGGSAPLFSSLLMLAIPARLAGVQEIVVVTPPPNKAEILNPAIAYCARRLGIDEIYLVGGAQAVAALAYGTQSIRPVQKICGPGNQYVTAAKMLVAAEGIAIDMPAGPSEVLIIADADAPPKFLAADLLAQAEHGIDSDVVLITQSRTLLEVVEQELAGQLETLPRAAIAAEVLTRARGIVLKTIDAAIEFSNCYAPEHLILSVATPERYVAQISNAGSVFLGYMAAESLGDYASGTNHVLPTNRYATVVSGVSVDTFVKKITFQAVTARGLLALSDAVVEMARAEGLEAHARAVIVREEGI